MESKPQEQFVTTRDLTLSAAFAAVYVISTFLPVTVFIGGAAFITLEIVIIPLIAALLKPVPATISIVMGAVGMAIFQNGVYPVFGVLGLLVPIIATVLGSLAFHSRLGPVLPWAYVLIGAVYYLTYSKGGTLLWLAPYIIVIVSLPLALTAKGNRSTVLLVLYTAMSEQVTLNILSIGVAGLVGGIWTIITPFMFLERTIATLGGTSLIVALKSRLEPRLPLSRELVGR